MGAMNGHELNPGEPPLPENLGQIRPIRRRRRRRRRRGPRYYNKRQKRQAILILELGVPCRLVAQVIGPRCSSSTPVRWRQEARARPGEMEHIMRDYPWPWTN